MGDPPPNNGNDSETKMRKMTSGKTMKQNDAETPTTKGVSFNGNQDVQIQLFVVHLM